MRKVQSGTSSLLFKLLVCILTVSAQRHQPRRLAEVDIETLLARITATLQDAWTAPVPVGYAFWRSGEMGGCWVVCGCCCVVSLALCCGCGRWGLCCCCPCGICLL
ncbi:hypothetical protein B484DRAFT_187466 [Ochromonadaceae sp. CCMP2298]|nr:hypothetical protein B484DRAFT_187466 [Ochromonadaceae sp. CCMP2298]